MRGPSNPNGQGVALPMYHGLAPYYDAIYAWKNYALECRRLESVARRFGRSGGTSWLDVACGTGRHLEYLRRRHACVGVDASPEMLRIARQRLPGIRFVRGDMRTFDLREKFDVVSCLFSAVGHLRTERDLAKSFANFARHLRPGGVVIVEPWLEPSRFRPGSVHLRTYEDPKVTIVRVAYSSRRGNQSIIRYSFLIGEPERGIHHIEEVDRGFLASSRLLQELMRKTGLTPRFFRHGFTQDRGLLVGMKPVSAARD